MRRALGHQREGRGAACDLAAAILQHLTKAVGHHSLEGGSEQALAIKMVIISSIVLFQAKIRRELSFADRIAWAAASHRPDSLSVVMHQGHTGKHHVDHRLRFEG